MVAIRLALKCVGVKPTERPSINDVADEIETILKTLEELEEEKMATEKEMARIMPKTRKTYKEELAMVSVEE